ncbi:hypothetical protein DSO57_1014566 [Entomophthora muscae]|uniref:Uncharacterized protein n=1 Tax=Entomophthora muscae TaxID=34485 RepID=A0ACC2SUU6_9FUNG|nr:hypothetical protein DSO57_1014566 [Entomophthora muscae]
MSSLLSFEKAKFGILCVKAAALRKDVPTSSIEESWSSLEVTKTAPEESLVEVKAAFEELYSNYFTKEEIPAQGKRIYAWDSWNLLLGFNDILQQVKDRANCEIEALRNREEKSVEIMACWWDNNKALAHKIASLEKKLLEALSQEGNSNKSHRQDNDKLDWLYLDLSNAWEVYLLIIINDDSPSVSQSSQWDFALGNNGFAPAVRANQQPGGLDHSSNISNVNVNTQDDSPLVNPSSQSGAPKLSEFGPAVWLNHGPYDSQHPLLGTSMDINVSPGAKGFIWTYLANHCPHGLVTPSADDLNANITDDDSPRVNSVHVNCQDQFDQSGRAKVIANHGINSKVDNDVNYTKSYIDNSNVNVYDSHGVRNPVFSNPNQPEVPGNNFKFNLGDQSYEANISQSQAEYNNESMETDDTWGIPHPDPNRFSYVISPMEIDNTPGAS